MNNVTYLSPTTTFTPEQALNSALSETLKDVLIIGYDESGQLFIRSSRLTCADAVFLLERAKLWALAGGQ